MFNEGCVRVCFAMMINVCFGSAMSAKAFSEMHFGNACNRCIKFIQTLSAKDSEKLASSSGSLLNDYFKQTSRYCTEAGRNNTLYSFIKACCLTVVV